MLRFFHLIKVGLIFGIVIVSALGALKIAFEDIVVKTERFSIENNLVSLQQYFNKQLVEFEEVSAEWASNPAVTALYKKNNARNRKKLLKSKFFKKAGVGFFSLNFFDGSTVISKRFNATDSTFSKLDEKTKYQITKEGFIKTIVADRGYKGFIFSNKLYMLSVVPVYPERDRKESVGYLIVGREVIKEQVKTANLMDVDINSINPAASHEQLLLLSKLKEVNVLHSRTRNSITSRFLLKDFNENPVAFISHKRSIPNALFVAKTSVVSSSIVLLVAFVISYLLWLLRRGKLNRSIKELEKDIGDVRVGSELSSRLSVGKRGVLRGIVVSLNQKIGGFEKTFVDNRKHNAEIILNELPIEAYLKDLSLKYVAVNEKYCKSVGVEKEELIGKHNVDLNSENDLGLISENEAVVIMSKQSIVFEETTYSERKGKVIYSVQLIPFISEKGGVEGLVGVRMDITDQKQAEDEMEMAAKVLENTAEGFMVTNSDRRIVHVNKAYTVMTGYEENEFLGKIPLLLQPESKSKTYQEIQEKLKLNGSWEGELWSSRRNGSSFPEMISIKAICNKQGEVTNYFSMSKDITEEKKWEKQLYEMAHYDSLTGLPNRTLFQDRLTQEIIRCERYEKHVAVLFLDIDLFKAINDSLGHAAGDDLLKIISNRLKETLRSVDSIARMGGDEFTILVTDLAVEYKKNVGYLRNLSEKIIEVVNQPMEIEGRDISVTCSIGVAVYPDDANNVDDLLRNADSAMYYAKSQGRRNYQFYSKEFNEAAVDRLEKEIEFRAALKKGELQLYYQAQVDVISRHVVGAEALLRWTKDGGNILGPEKIVLLAEEIGLINELGDWILKTACIECKKWIDSGHKNLRVAVNLSTRQFRQKNLVEIVERILDETQLPGRYLELEVTESALMESVEYSVEMMAELSRKGIRWSLDDFGTGYSSLNYLRDFPVHVLKVDQSFVREITINPEDSAIVKTIIDLAHRLHLTVIAEGVESEEQLKALARMNCELVQGYYFSKPRNSEEFINYVTTGE